MLPNDDEMRVTMMSVQFRRRTHGPTRVGVLVRQVEISHSVFILSRNTDTVMMTVSRSLPLAFEQKYGECITVLQKLVHCKTFQAVKPANESSPAAFKP